MGRHAFTDSSMILAISYESDEQLLIIEFQNGKTYEYRLVPKSVFLEFCDASSAGEFFPVCVR